MLTVVVPTLNSEATLPAALAPLIPAACDGVVRQVIVADGGSNDATLAIGEELGCEIVAAPRGRGAQLAAGAKAARQPWLLFLHADTLLESGWYREVVTFAERNGSSEVASRAAYFRFALDDYSPAARWLEQLVAVRCALLALPYGDQGLLISRRHYDQLGGFRDIPIMEDVDIVRRIGRRSLVTLRTRAITSAARYRRNGYLARMARNVACLTLYFLRVPPRLILRLYA